jgi:hypothetical protein
VSSTSDLDQDGVIDETVEEIGLHDNGGTQLTTCAVALGPVHQSHVAALHGFFR